MASGGNQNPPMAYESNHAVLAKDAAKVGGSGQMQQQPQHTVVQTMPGQPMPGQPMPVQYATAAPYGGGGAYGGGGYGGGRGGLNSNDAAGMLICGVACIYIVIPLVCYLIFMVIGVIGAIVFGVMADNESRAHNKRFRNL